MIDIRPIMTQEDLRAAERVQREAWGMGDDELVSAHTLHALAHNGAVLLGAYDGAQLVGLVLGTLGVANDPQRADRPVAERLKMYSVMAGVLPAYQTQGIGRRLKLAQREQALKMGLAHMTWTYDPLESRNGRLNIHNLGATCCTYLRHFHGDMSGINAGLPTDRLEVDWWLTSERVERRLMGEERPLSLSRLVERGVPVVNGATFDDRNLPVPASTPGPFLLPDQPDCLVEIPASFQTIKTADFALARAWRLSVRQVLESLFAAGFVITEFFHMKVDNGRSRSYYLLQK